MSGVTHSIEARPKLKLEIAEAFWKLGSLPVGQLQDIALRALADGYDGPALRELAEFPWATRRDVGDLFDIALSEMGRPVLSDREAGLRLAREVASGIVSGGIDPYEGARRIWWDIWERSGRPEELIPFVALSGQYEDEPAHREQYVEDIVAEANRLIAS